jgi:hypothetical protein
MLGLTESAKEGIKMAFDKKIREMSLRKQKGLTHGTINKPSAVGRAGGITSRPSTTGNR